MFPSKSVNSKNDLGKCCLWLQLTKPKRWSYKDVQVVFSSVLNSHRDWIDGTLVISWKEISFCMIYISWVFFFKLKLWSMLTIFWNFKIRYFKIFFDCNFLVIKLIVVHFVISASLITRQWLTVLQYILNM